MAPKKCFDHYIKQWERRNGRGIEVKLNKIKPHPDAVCDGVMHSVALYVDGFLVARASARSISAAKDIAATKAMRLFGLPTFS